ncbi:41246_t:CDS:2, partial [Gigaspora margarita]
NETDIDVLIADQADEADRANENEAADINDPEIVVNQHILRVSQVQE